MAQADQLIKMIESQAAAYVAGMPGDTQVARLAYHVGLLHGEIRKLCDELKAVSNPSGCFETRVDGVVIGVVDNGPEESPDFMIGGQVVGDILSLGVERKVWRDFEANMLAERQEAA